MKDGAKFTISTVQTQATVRELVPGLNLRYPIVTMNGAALYDMKTLEYLRTRPMSDGDAERIIHWLRAEKRPFFSNSAAPIMALTAGIMSFFSSGLGVVFPTLVPLCAQLASGIGADGVLLVAMVVIGGTIAGYTPISTTGALIMAGVAQQENAEERFLQNKLFIELFAVPFINLAVLALMAILGIYKLFV